MRKYSRWVVIIITFLLLTFSYFALFGLSRRSGEVKVDLIKGLREISFSSDISGGVEATFLSKETLTNNLFIEVSSALKNRLSNMGLNENGINIYHNKDRVILSFGIDKDDVFFTKDTIKSLGENQSLFFVLGKEKDGEIILQGGDFSSAEVELINGSPPVIHFTLSKEEKNGQPSAESRFKTLTKSIVKKDIPVSVWYKDDFLLNIWVDEVLTSGEISIVDETFTEQFAKDLSQKINTKTLMSELILENYGYNSHNSHLSLARLLLKIIIIILIISSIILVFLYRLSGIISSILMVSLTAAITAIFSGYLSSNKGINLSLYGLFGIIIVIIVSFFSHLFLNQRIKEELNLGKSLDGAITSGFKYSNNLRLKLNVILLVIGLLIMAAFDIDKGIISIILTPLFFATDPLPNTYIYSFGVALASGSIINHFLIRFLTLPMINSLTGFYTFKNKTLFGGNLDE